MPKPTTTSNRFITTSPGSCNTSATKHVASLELVLDSYLALSVYDVVVVECVMWINGLCMSILTKFHPMQPSKSYNLLTEDTKLVKWCECTGSGRSFHMVGRYMTMQRPVMNVMVSFFP
ncbi:unnamed protein product [Cochlearia groenlandica]